MLRPENSNRRIDNLGRITLPKGLRDRFDLLEGVDMELYTMEMDGKIYICLTKAEDAGVARKRIAAEVLRELGFEVPAELE